MTVVTCPNCGAKNRVDESRAGRLQPVCGKCGRKLDIPGAGNGEPVELTDENFAATALQSGPTPVLVDCWAPWCPPCRAIAPSIDQLAAESSGRYVVAKINIDDNPQTAGRYTVESIPT